MAQFILSVLKCKQVHNNLRRGTQPGVTNTIFGTYFSYDYSWWEYIASNKHPHAMPYIHLDDMHGMPLYKEIYACGN
jgi:hypothetical protein